MERFANRLNVWCPDPSIRFQHDDGRILLLENGLVGVLYWKRRQPLISFIRATPAQPVFRAHILRTLSASYQTNNEPQDVTSPDVRFPKLEPDDKS